MNQPINQSVSQDQASDGETNEHVDNVEFINETKECMLWSIIRIFMVIFI